MGRYYSGDIEGKFWFAIQNSDAADRFGCTGQQPNCLDYYFDKEDHYDDIKKELAFIKKKLGKKFKKIETIIANSGNLSDSDITREDLSEYADYELGLKIKSCLEKQDYCSFTAEM